MVEGKDQQAGPMSPPLHGSVERRRRWPLLGVAAAMLATATVTTVPGTASAAGVLPTLPDNIVVFPMRDFLTVEGFERHLGGTAVVKVFRGDQVMGYTEAPVTIPEPEVAFEVNHPGGVCWGVNAPDGLDVTPDIQGGDRIEVVLDGVTYETPVASVEVLDEARVGNVVTVVNEVPSSIPLERLEGRIIEPALGDTEVGRRDARATADGNGDDGYTSRLFRDPETGHVVAEYTFASEATAEIALGGTSRIMSWVATVGEERAGITIYEHEEVGGPGMGGCPPGPADAVQPGPGEAVIQRSLSGTEMAVFWEPAAPVAGAEPITGYQVTLTDAGGAMVGRKVGADVTRADFANLSASAAYLVEVRSAQGTKLSEPFVVESVAPAPVDDPARDTEDPPLGYTYGTTTGLLTATTESGAQVYYTFGTTDLLVGDMPSAEAQRYQEPIPITEPDTVVNLVAFDAAGNWTSVSTPPLQPPTEAPAPEPLAVPVLEPAIAGPGLVDLRWNAVDGATDYQVTVRALDPTSGATLEGVEVQQPPGTFGARNQRITDLEPGTTYGFTVRALAADRPSSAESDEVWATPDEVLSVPAIERAQYRAGKELRVAGSTTAVSGTVTVHASNPAGEDLGQIGNPVTVTAAVAPETGGEFELRLRNNLPPNPGWVIAVGDDGGSSAPFQVATR